MAVTREPISKVLVIIPTYNESENIASIVGRIRRAVPDAHVLIADDNSPDGTGKIADDLAAADDHLHVMHRAGKEGLAAAYIAGFRWGLENGFDALVEHDADGSHQPEHLPQLLAALAEADMVKGSRYVKGGSVVNWPKSRELLSRGGNLWTQFVLGIPIKDATGGFNAFRADTLRAILPDLEASGYAFQVNLAWQSMLHGFKVVEVPIEFIEREFGASKMSQKIIIEALALTTKWGIAHRLNQVKGLFGKVGSGARDVSRYAAEQAPKIADDATKLAKDVGKVAVDVGEKVAQEVTKLADQAKAKLDERKK